MNYQTCPVYDCCGGTIIRDNGMRARCRTCDGRGVVEAPRVTVTHDGPPVVTPARDAEAIERAAYERGLRRGMAIANKHLVGVMGGWDRAEDAVEREIYAAAIGEEAPSDRSVAREWMEPASKGVEADDRFECPGCRTVYVVGEPEDA